jgi:hypothetical protein
MSTLNPTCAKDQWYRLDPEAAAHALISECNRAIQNNESRRSEALVFASLFEGVELTSFDERGYTLDNDEVFRDLNIPIVRNTCRSIVQTGLSKMTAQDSPLPQFMSNGGDWETRCKAVRLDRLVSAEYAQPQGQFANLHELFRHGALIAMAATGSFGVFYLPGPDTIIAELDDTLSIGLECSGRFGRVISMVRTAWYNPEELIARFPDFEDEILMNEDIMPNGMVRDDTGDDIKPERGVKVHQGWRVMLGKKNYGRELFVLKDGTILKDDQEYKRDRPPVAFWHYERALYGHWGVSLTRTIYAQCQRINQIINDVDYAEQNSPQGMVLYKKGATKPGDLEKVKGWQMVELNGTGNLGEGFQIVEPPKFNSQSVELLLFHESGAHDTSGISQQHAAAKRSVGTTSGKHENMVAALFTERFADTERRLIDMRTTASAKLIVWALQDMIEEVPDYKRIYAKGDYVEEIELKDLDLDLDRYTISIAPVSEDKNSPRARMESADKWFEAGLMSGGELLSFQQDYDAKAKSQLALAQENWLERQIDMWLHSDEVKYQGPIQWMDLPAAAKTAAQALLIARTKGAPGDRLAWFTRFLDEVQAFIDQASLQAATSVTSEVDPGLAFPGAGASAPSPAPPAGPAGAPAGPMV